MKFGKLYRATIAARMPHWGEHMMQYKQLKQAINLATASSAGAEPSGLCAGFAGLLDQQVEVVNGFYMERVEEGIIILHQLHTHAQQMRAGKLPLEDSTACQRSLVAFHFQCVLLEHFVALNFTALTKILKKFEKKLGAELKADYMAAIVELPFYSCEELRELVEECERQFRVFEELGTARGAEGVGERAEAAGPCGSAAERLGFGGGLQSQMQLHRQIAQQQGRSISLG